MDMQLVKVLTDCLVSAQEAQEFLTEGNFRACQGCIQRLIERLDRCIDDALRSS